MAVTDFAIQVIQESISTLAGIVRLHKTWLIILTILVVALVIWNVWLTFKIKK